MPKLSLVSRGVWNQVGSFVEIEPHCLVLESLTYIPASTDANSGCYTSPLPFCVLYYLALQWTRRHRGGEGIGDSQTLQPAVLASQPWCLVQDVIYSKRGQRRPGSSFTGQALITSGSLDPRPVTS